MLNKQSTPTVIWIMLIIINFVLVSYSIQSSKWFKGSTSPLTAQIKDQRQEEEKTSSKQNNSINDNDLERAAPTLQKLQPIQPPPKPVEEQVELTSKQTNPSELDAKKDKNGDPIWTGQISNMSALDFERMIAQYNGMLLIYDVNRKQYVRAIKQGMPISLERVDMSGLHRHAHNITDELEQSSVKSWLEEANTIFGKSRYRIEARLGSYYQDKLYAMARNTANQNNMNYTAIDRVMFSFQKRNIVLEKFVVEGKPIKISKPLAS